MNQPMHAFDCPAGERFDRDCTCGLRALMLDKARLDWMDEHLRRDAKVIKGGRAVRTSHAWAIAGELDTLRETVDGVMAATPKETK